MCKGIKDKWKRLREKRKQLKEKRKQLKEKRKQLKEKKRTYRGPSYTLMIVLIFVAALLAGIVIWQCIKVNNLYKQGQADLAEIKETFATLEQFAEENPSVGEDGTSLQIELSYPSVLSGEAENLQDIISIIQEDNAQALSCINSYLVVFSILITAVVIVVPLFNYWFIQKDQVIRLNEQYDDYKKESTAELSAIKESSSSEIERLDGLYAQYSKRSDVVIERMQKSIKLIMEVVKANADLNMKGKQETDVTEIESISTAPKDEAFAHYVRANLLLSKRDYSQSLIEIYKAIRLEPKNSLYTRLKEILLETMGQYVITRDKGGVQFTLKAKNHKIIGISQVFSSLSDCKNVIRLVKKYAPVANVEEQTVKDGKAMGNPTFSIYGDEIDGFRYKLYDNNGDEILFSDSYKTKAACLDAIDNVRRYVESEVIIK